jgi:hypothetical protein
VVILGSSLVILMAWESGGRLAIVAPLVDTSVRPARMDRLDGPVRPSGACATGVGSLYGDGGARMTSTQRGSIVGATWLIGIGLVFLVQRAADLPWVQAWPLWVILVGASLVVTALVNGRWDFDGIWALTWPVVFIVIGVLLLLSTTGALGSDVGSVIADVWPWILIGLGAWFVIGAIVPIGQRLQEALVVPLDGATEGGVQIRFGAGTLNTHAAAAGNLVDGRFEGGVLHRGMGAGKVSLEQDTRYGVPWLERSSRWDVGLATSLPLELRIDVGASRSVLDLRELQLRRLDLKTGASETRIVLPQAAGATTVDVSQGAAALTIEAPTGVAVRLRSRMGLGSVSVDQSRFPAVPGGYMSGDYETAANRVEIHAEGGVGSLRLISAA